MSKEKQPPENIKQTEGFKPKVVDQPSLIIIDPERKDPNVGITEALEKIWAILGREVSPLPSDKPKLGKENR